MHKRRLTILLPFLLLAITVAVGPRAAPELQAATLNTSYRTYHNARFDYSISYPVNVLIPQGEAANGDGQKFLSKDHRTEMLVYGAYNSLNRTLREVFEEESARSEEHPNRAATYKVLREDWFVVSGTENGKVFYQKTILRGDTFKTFRIEYDESQKRIFDPITVKIARSFRG